MRQFECDHALPGSPVSSSPSTSSWPYHHLHQQFECIHIFQKCMCLHEAMERKFSKYYFTHNFSLIVHCTLADLHIDCRFPNELLRNKSKTSIWILCRKYFPFKLAPTVQSSQNLYFGRINLFVVQYSLKIYITWKLRIQIPLLSGVKLNKPKM